MNAFALGTPRPIVTKHFRRPLSESSSAGNRGTPPRSTTPNRGGRPPTKKARTDSLPPSSPLTSSQGSSAASFASSPPSYPSPLASQISSIASSQDASNTPEPSQAPADDPPASDPPEDLFEDVPDGLFDDIDLYDVPPTPSPDPYDGPPQPPERLQGFIARHPYTAEPERHYLGPMDKPCPKCMALRWEDETEGWCCDKGKTEVSAPETTHEDDIYIDELSEDYVQPETSANGPVHPDEDAINKILHSIMPGTTALTPDSKEFRQHSVQYNNAASMASQQVTINHSVAPYTCRVQGAITTHMPALAPPEGERSVFGQIYMMDSSQEQAAYRHGFHEHTKESLHRKIARHLKQINPYIAALKTMSERLADDDNLRGYRLLHENPRHHDPRTYNRPTSDEVAVAWEGDADDLLGMPEAKDVLIEAKSGERHKVPLHASRSRPGQAPRRIARPTGRGGCKRVTQASLYRYWMQIRPRKFSRVLHCGRLLQHFVCDAYVAVESNNLHWYKVNQKTVRADTYQAVVDAQAGGATTGAQVGKQRVVLPTTHIGGPRFMKQLYQDTIALSTRFGRPDLFTTFTCNPNWKEVKENLLPGERATDRPDLIARVFRLKLRALLDDILKKKVLGRTPAHAYTVEFQKRGLPHAHILIILHPEDRFFTAAEVDATVSAEIPNERLYPNLYATVTRCMLHGNCSHYATSKTGTVPPCWDSDKDTCSKGFPKDFCDHTVFEPDFGYPKYRRRRPATAPEDDSKQNCWVVPYSPYLSAKYDAHINVEICANVKACKYIFKYVHKGSDRASLQIVPEDQQGAGAAEADPVDEIQEYRDARWVGSAEACWRIFGFKLHDQNPPVERLTIHLPNRQGVEFDADDDIADVLSEQEGRQTKLTVFFELNQQRHDRGDVEDLLYPNVSDDWVWNRRGKWTVRKRDRGTIARMYYINPNAGELFYLRYLLLNVPSPKSFEDLRTVNGDILSTYHGACVARGLLQNDAEWDQTLEEAGAWQGGRCLRSLFVMILLNCDPSDPLDLWNKHRARLSDDCIHILQTDYQGFPLPDGAEARQAIAEDFCLHLIETRLEENNTSSTRDVRLSDFGLPGYLQEYDQYHNDGRNRFLREEHGHQTDGWNGMWDSLNDGQTIAADAIWNSVVNSTGQLFFLDGYGGTGKTMLQNTVLRRVRSDSKVAIAVASSGIASILLQGGRTAHSRFKIPLNATDQSACSVAINSDLAELFRVTELIFWDEVSMQNRHDIEAVDRMLQDVRGNTDPFGGIVTCFCGDFRQVLPVIKGAESGRIAQATLRASRLWSHIQILRLSENMRLRNPNLTDQGRVDMEEFAQNLLDVGNGTATSTVKGHAVDWSTGWLAEDSATALVDAIYNDIGPHRSADFYTSRAILCTLNKNVARFNAQVLDKFPGAKTVCQSRDQVVNEEDNFLLPTEIMNAFEPAALPPHHLELKQDCVVMLLRNLEQVMGLCNGTRLQVKHIGTKTLDCRILGGEHDGKRHYIPRIPLSPPDSNSLHAPFRRIQYPVRLAFSMTINKSQGQSLQHVGLCLYPEVFAHGQLYVALSRVTSKNGLAIVATKDLPRKQPNRPARCIKNKVIKQVLLPAASS